MVCAPPLPNLHLVLKQPHLQDGYDLDGFLDEFPSVARADAEEFLRLARSEASP